jgi:hypothetical protein
MRTHPSRRIVDARSRPVLDPPASGASRSVDGGLRLLPPKTISHVAIALGALATMGIVLVVSLVIQRGP